MAEWRFALSRRWLGYIGFAVAFAIACGFLSSWQLARSREAAAANAIVAENFDGPVRPFDTVLPGRSTFRDGQEWTRVRVSGRYLTDDQLLVRNRPLDGNPGYEVLTPLRLADGSLFIVDRGWIPVANEGGPSPVAAPPRGEVTVTARLKPSEPSLNRQTPDGDTVPTIQLSLVRSLIGGDVHTGAYGLLESQDPSAAHPLKPTVTSPPNADEGLHWSYMIQWIIFACIGFFGLGYAFLQEYRRRNDSDATSRARRIAREKRRVARRSDADVEDEILDATR